jgi:hypothetical protein
MNTQKENNFVSENYHQSKSPPVPPPQFNIGAIFLRFNEKSTAAVGICLIGADFEVIADQRHWRKFL